MKDTVEEYYGAKVFEDTVGLDMARLAFVLQEENNTTEMAQDRILKEKIDLKQIGRSIQNLIYYGRKTINIGNFQGRFNG